MKLLFPEDICSSQSEWPATAMLCTNNLDATGVDEGGIS